MRRLRLAVCAAVFGSAGGQAGGSEEVQHAAVPPLSVRGINYYPRETPWGGMWTKTPAEVWEKDLALAASLGANTVRTFVSLGASLESAGLLHADGSPTAAYLAKIDAFLAAARRNRIRAILCFDFDGRALSRADGEPRWRRALSAVVGAHKGDSRVLMWDLMNEPDDDAKWGEGTRQYLVGAQALVRELGAEQPTTIGMTWRIDRIQQAVLPDVIQYHEYCPKRLLFERGSARVIETLVKQGREGGGRPVLIGEFGLCTSREPARGADASLCSKLSEASGTEAEQARLYAIVLEAAERGRVAGAVAWCLHDYPINNPNESHFGLVRSDGTLKPAAAVLREVFARWAAGPGGAASQARPFPDSALRGVDKPRADVLRFP